MWSHGDRDRERLYPRTKSEDENQVHLRIHMQHNRAHTHTHITPSLLKQQGQQVSNGREQQQQTNKKIYGSNGSSGSSLRGLSVLGCQQ